MRSDLEEALGRVRLAAFDVDGIFTDGGFWLDGQGKDLARFHTHDGLAVKLLMAEGVEVALVTGRDSMAVRVRAEQLGIERVHRGVEDKAAELRKISESAGVEPAEILFMGDDLPDLPAMAVAGVSVTVPNAAAEVKDRADLVTVRPGGDGAVREVAELLLSARGRWDSAVARLSGEST